MPSLAGRRGLTGVLTAPGTPPQRDLPTQLDFGKSSYDPSLQNSAHEKAPRRPPRCDAAAARRFFADQASGQGRFLICELVLVEIFMQLRNPAIFRKPRTARQAADFCGALRVNPLWEKADYEPEVAKPLWEWAAKATTGFRPISDARLALTLRHQGAFRHFP